MAPEKSLLLPQGCEDAQLLISQFPANPNYRWIAYDALAQQTLINAGISYEDEAYYLAGDTDYLKRLTYEAHRLSAGWFEGIRGSNPLYPEGFFIRALNYSFLSTFCAFRFLEKIREKEGPCELILCRYESSEADLLRDTAKPLTDLLEAFNHLWNFKIRWIKMLEKLSPVQVPIKKLFPFQKTGTRFSHGQKKNRVLFSGNPALLDPVRTELSEFQTATIRFIDSFRDMAALFDKNKVLLAVPEPEAADAYEVERLLARVKQERRLCFEGKDFYPVLEKKLRLLYFREIPKALALFNEARNFFKTAQPEYLILDEDVTERQRTLACAAKECGVKTLVIAHGLPGGPWGFLPLVSDHMAVWGAYAIPILKQWGLAAERLVITGCPKYDALEPCASVPVSLKEVICKKLGLDPEKPVILIVPGKFRNDPFDRFDGSGSTSTETLKTAHLFMEAAKRTPGVNIIFKFRADGQENKIFKELLFKNHLRPSNLVFVHEGLALDYLKIADLMFNNCSSACLEAVLMKKTVVNMNFSYYQNVFPFYETGLGALVKKAEDVFEIVRRLEKKDLPLQDWIDSQESLVRPFLYSRDGKSASRAGDFIRARLSGKNTLSETPELAVQN